MKLNRLRSVPLCSGPEWSALSIVEKSAVREVRSKICRRVALSISIRWRVPCVSLMPLFEAEVQTDGLHQLRRTKGFIREPAWMTAGATSMLSSLKPRNGNLFEFIGSPIAHIDRSHSAAKLRVTSDNVVGSMRNRGSADTNALLGRRLDLFANFLAYVAFDVAKVIDEHNVGAGHRSRGQWRQARSCCIF